MFNDRQPATPSLTQSGVSGEEGDRDMEEQQNSDDIVQDIADKSTPHPPTSLSLKMGISWVDSADDESAGTNDLSAAGGSANQPTSYAAAFVDGLHPLSSRPTPITPPATGLTSVAAATVSPRPCHSSRQDCPTHNLQRPPDITGGATAGEPRQHHPTLSCAPTDTALAVRSTRANQQTTKQKCRCPGEEGYQCHEMQL